MPDPVPQVGARTSWRPHFLRDETARIDVPALRFFWPFDEVSMNLRRLDRVAEIANGEVDCPGREESREYFAALAADEERQAELRRALLETDLQQALDPAMRRAFGDNLRTIRVSPDIGDWPAIQDFQAGHMRSFLEEVERVEGTRSHDASSTDASPHEVRFLSGAPDVRTSSRK